MKAQKFTAGFICGVAASAAIVSLSAWAASRNSAQEEKNKAIAIEFYNRGLNQLDFDKAAQLIGDQYVQHNPRAVDGKEGFKTHLDMLKKDFPQNHGDIKHALADGDLVALHVHSKRTPDSRGNAIVDIFRIDNGKVVEHWDVVQAVPEKSLNDNSMF